MNKNILVIIFYICLNYGQNYNVGETVSLEDQLVEQSICYGNYQNETFKFADLNGDLNGGSYKVLFIDMTATW